ncbi:hypothetical protein AB3S75_023419 [Citrus x aurantiifolia]
MSTNSKTSPNLPWKAWLSISTFSLAMHMSFRRNMTVNRFLFNLCDRKSSPSTKNGVTSFDVSVDATRDLWFRLYKPTNTTATNFPVIVYFHGGGFAILAANSKVCDDACRRLAEEVPAVVISVNYRRSPEHRCPNQYEDGIDALKFIDNSFTDIENFPACADIKQCFLAGDSAGGNLAHNVAVLADGCNFSRLRLNGLIVIQPFFGGEERTESEMRFQRDPLVGLKLTDWMWKAFLPEGSNRDHPAANVFGPNAGDISGVNLPPTIIFIGGFDPLQDGGKRYHEGLKKCGKDAHLIEYPNAVHCFYLFPEVPECSLFLKEVKDFICSQAAK